MKTPLAILAVLFLSLISNAQNQGPDVAWKYHDIPEHVPTGVIIDVKSGSSVVAGEDLTFDESGEDWWYDIINVMEGGVQTGYAACGFATWLDIELNEKTNPTSPGCKDRAAQDAPHCGRPVRDGEAISSKLTTIARYDLNGNMIWCNFYAFGTEGAISLIQTEDEGFAFTGWGNPTRDIDGQPVTYNPTSGFGGEDFAAGFCDEPTQFTQKLVAGKIDIDGVLEWIHMYGFLDFGNITHSDTEIAKAESLGYTLIKSTTNPNNIIVLGRCQDLDDVKVLTDGSVVAFSKIFALKLNEFGEIIDRSLIGPDGYFITVREITEDFDNGGYLATGFQIFDKTSAFGDDAEALLFRLKDDFTQLNFGNDLWGDPGKFAELRPSSPGKNNIGWDVKMLNGGKIAWAHIDECEGCKGGSNSFGDGIISLFDDITPGSPEQIIDLAIVNTLGFSQIHAYDLKMALVSSGDGGFACLTTYQVFEPDLSDATYNPIVTLLNAQISGEMCLDGLPTPIDFKDAALEIFQQHWNTDAYVAKFDAGGTFLWDKSFDADNAPVTFFPGDYKEQECVFRMTEATDGSLVFVGNTSHNRDDYYIAKINNDCHVRKDLSGGFTVEDDFDHVITIDNCDLTWDNTFPVPGASVISLAGSLVIEPGAHLTISGLEVQFADSRKLPYVTNIVVKPGGKLTLINDATLTSISDCPSSMWDGIQVHGNWDQPQTPELQGQLVMNNAKIENAVIGVAAVKRDNFVKDLTKTGGILKIQNSEFKNNLISVEMRPYPNPDSGLPDDNVSFIQLTEFHITAPLNDPEIANVTEFLDPDNSMRVTEPRAHQEFILVVGIKGLPIRGNTFTLDAAIADDFVGARKGYGILAWDSDVIVEPHQFFSGSPVTKNVFNNNWIAIYGKPMGQVNNYYINDNVFNNNHISVAFDGSANYSTIINNDFNIPEAIGDLEDANMGIYIESATGLTIEGNNFDGLAQTSGATNGGIFIKDASVAGSAEIYRNTFNRLDVIIQTDGDNKITNVDCNDFNNDLSGGNQILWHNTSGIDSEVKDQGSCPFPAGLFPQEPQANRFLGTYNFPNFTVLNEGASFKYDSYNVPDYIMSFDIGADDMVCALEISINPLAACPVLTEDPDPPGFTY
ncbi:hypothetical protein JYT74_00200 [Crocinitomix catalasitica]|nr:hypothetical protein [Crocinitomix catalasitica]